jgi:hypothetical protein
MSCGGPLSPVMMIAGAGLLPGAGGIAGLGSSLGVSSSLTSAISNFTSLPVVSQFSSVVSAATGSLSGGVLDSLRTMGQDFTALTNAIPSSFTSALSAIAPGGVANGGLTGLISQTAQGIMGGPLGDLTQFGQIFNSAQGFVGQANQFINSNSNIGAIANTFAPLTGGMDSLITGSFSQVTEAFGSFGSDLSRLGSLIDMNNLPNLGAPSALVKQLASVGGLVPGVETALRSAGLDSLDIANLATGGFTNVSASADRLLYQGLENITGTELAQVKNILGVTTPNIASMADLLDPKKILPNSFPALTMPTPDGLRGIYADVGGAVNTNIERWLQDPSAPAYTGDDPIVRARLGLDRDSDRTILT